MPTFCGGHANNTHGCGRTRKRWRGGQGSRNVTPRYSPNGDGRPRSGWLDEKSRVSREVHARICGSRRMRFPPATRPDVVGDVLPAPGQSGGHIEAAGRRHPNIRGADRGGSRRADRGRADAGTPDRVDLSRRLVRIPAEAFGAAGGGALSTAVFPEGLGPRLGCRPVLRLGAARPDGHSGRGQYRPAVGAAVCEAVARRAAAAPGWHSSAAGSGDPTRVSGLARAGEPVHALRVRPVPGPGVPGRAVRALRRRWCATNVEGGFGVEDELSECGVVLVMEVWPSGIALQGEVSNHRVLLR